MGRISSAKGLLAGVIVTAFVFAGCGYSIKYRLNERDIIMAKSTQPLTVSVAKFSESRPEEEREKSARKKKGDRDIGDFTYDNQFRGTVSEEVSKMLVEHLNYSRTFEKVTLAPFDSEDFSMANMDSLGKAGIDAVLTGEIDHFYGYYDQNIGRKLLLAVPLGVASGLLLNWSFSSGNTQYTVYWYGPGLVMGYYLESLVNRKIEYATQLKAKLVSTSTREVIWEDTLEVSEQYRGAMPGISTEQRKFQITVKSLRSVVNKMVESLSQESLTTKL